MNQLTAFSRSSHHLFTLLIVLLAFINNIQVSAYGSSSDVDYRQNSPIYSDFSYENLESSELPMSIKPKYAYTSDNDEEISRNPWSQLFHRHHTRSALNPTYYVTSQSGFPARHHQIRYIPYPSQKRTIPIELQKALLAHGIVGRRR